MKWITEISIDNYRAFGKKEVIEIPKGNHLLIYGENGSGKSSIYNALKDFFASSIQESNIKFKLNKFQEEDKKNLSGKIDVSISGNNKTSENNKKEVKNYSFSNTKRESNNNVSEIMLSRKIKGFLSYKEMLKFHSFEIPDNQQPNLFYLIIKELLGEHIISTEDSEVWTRYNKLKKIIIKPLKKYDLANISEIEQRLSDIEESIEKLNVSTESENKIQKNRSELNILESEKDIASKKLENLKAIEQLNEFNKLLFNLLEKVIKKSNYYLETYFKNKMVIGGNIRLIYEKKKMIEELFLEIKYAGKRIDNDYRECQVFCVNSHN